MSNKVSSADNQQGSRPPQADAPSETIRRTPLSKAVIQAYCLGSLHDGTFSSNKRFRISQKGTSWLKVLCKLFKKAGYNSWIYREGKKREVYVLETLAKFLDLDFDPDRLSTSEEKIAYVRGFFDAEGGIPRRKRARFYIQLTQNDMQKLGKIKQILGEFQIGTGKIHNPSKNVDPEYWRMYILARSHKSFIEKIGSWHPRKVAVLRKRMMI